MQREPAATGNCTTVSLYLSSLNGLRTAVWYAQELAASGVRPIVCTHPAISDIVKDRLAGDKLEVVGLEALTATEQGISTAHARFADYLSRLTPGDNRVNLAYLGPKVRWKRLSYVALRRACGLLPPRTVNRLLTRAFSGATRWRFPSRHVVVISFPRDPVLLCASRARIDTVVDSWDHPARRTAGYDSDLAIAWNQEIADGWQRYQGCDATALGPPIRLAYALDAGPVRPDPGTERVVMYPVATTHHVPAWFNDELRVLAIVLEEAGKAGWKVLVKPKPASDEKSIVDLCARHEHVSIGKFHAHQSAVDYELSDAYNEVRVSEMSAVSLAINTVTTFGLDAACAQVPLLQLDLSQVTDAPAFANAYRNYHIRRHLAPVADSRPTSLRQLRELLERSFSQPDWAEYRRASASLRNWVAAASDTIDAIERIAGPL